MKEFKDKLHLAIIEAIKNVETNSEEEIGVKLEYLVNIDKILINNKRNLYK